MWQIKHLFLLNTHPSNHYHKLEFSFPLTHFQVQWSLWSLPEIKSFEEFFSLKLLYAHIQMLTVLLRSQLLFPEDAGLQMPRCFWNGCYPWVKKAVISFPILLKLWKAMGTFQMTYSSWMSLYQFALLQIACNIYFLYSKT